MAQSNLKAAVLGASGYTGAEMLRLIALHPSVDLAAASAGNLAGKSVASVFPHLQFDYDAVLMPPDQIDWPHMDVVFSCLPHGTSQDILLSLPSNVRIIDLSADFRFRDATVYEATYDRSHSDRRRSETSVYGLTEFSRAELKSADIIACPGCYPTAALLSLLPSIGSGQIQPQNITIDAKSGVSGAGRGLKEGNLFCEAAEGLHPYAVGQHRHAPEIEQELSRLAGVDERVSFTPHLVPMTRGELVTSYVFLKDGVTAADLHKHLSDRYRDEPFVFVRDFGALPPDTRHTRGTNNCIISVHADRVPGRAILISAIDNLIKGSSGQALQNLNVAMGWDETLGLSALSPLFP